MVCAGPSAGFTSIWCGFHAPPFGNSFAVPAIESILFFLNRKPMPLLTLSAMPRLRAMIAGKSASTEPTLMPKSFACWK
jgi:hypothetical protein